jgi:hypothetical protein
MSGCPVSSGQENADRRHGQPAHGLPPADRPVDREVEEALEVELEMTTNSASVIGHRLPCTLQTIRCWQVSASSSPRSPLLSPRRASPARVRSEGLVRLAQQPARRITSCRISHIPLVDQHRSETATYSRLPTCRRPGRQWLRRGAEPRGGKVEMSA